MRADGEQMATVAARLPRERSLRVKPARIVATLAVTAAGLYMAMRVPTAIEMQRGLLRMCAQVGMQPGDWLCEVTTTSTLATFVPSSLLVGLGLALPCAVLVASGRRVVAFLPLLVPAADVAGVAILNLISDASARADQSMLGIFGGPLLSGWAMQGHLLVLRPVLACDRRCGPDRAPVLGVPCSPGERPRPGCLATRPPVGAAASAGYPSLSSPLRSRADDGLESLGSPRTPGHVLPSGDAWMTMLVIATSACCSAPTGGSRLGSSHPWPCS